MKKHTATATTMWLIDDDPALRLVLEDNFESADFNVISFAQAQGAWMRLNEIKQGKQPDDELPDVILTDIRMPMMDGLSFSDWVNKNFPAIPVVIMTAHSDLKAAVDSYQTGAFEYLPKPFDLDEAITIVNKAVGVKAMANTNKDKLSNTSEHNTKKSAKENDAATPKNNEPKARKKTKQQNLNPSGIIGQSIAMQNVFRAIGRLAHSPITVLITGESGTGKELVAHALHETSPRSQKPLIALNMAAIPHDLIESELFGHEKGAFTGATNSRQGRFEQANGGTLFLDEIGDMPFSTQTRLLRVLANGEFFRVGGQKPIKVDVRIIAATHQNLEELVKQGKFREDLFYRLNVIRLPLPALRERKEDIPTLVEHFLSKAAKELDSKQKLMSDEAMQVMRQFNWQGNVRQLENACRWLTVMAAGDTVMIEDLPPELLEFIQTQTPDEQLIYEQEQMVGLTNTILNKTLKQPLTPISNNDSSKNWAIYLQQWANATLQAGKNEILSSAMPTFETVMIDTALTHTKGNKGKAAELLGWGRNTLTRKIQQLGLDTKW